MRPTSAEVALRLHRVAPHGLKAWWESRPGVVAKVVGRVLREPPVAVPAQTVEERLRHNAEAAAELPAGYREFLPLPVNTVVRYSDGRRRYVIIRNTRLHGYDLKALSGGDKASGPSGVQTGPEDPNRPGFFPLTHLSYYVERGIGLVVEPDQTIAFEGVEANRRKHAYEGAFHWKQVRPGVAEAGRHDAKPWAGLAYQQVPVRTAPAKPSSAPAPSTSERAAEWTSPTYGRVVVRDGEWRNISAAKGPREDGSTGSVRYGWNGERWARKLVPPEDLLAEVIAHGWTLFGPGARAAATPSTHSPKPAAPREPKPAAPREPKASSAVVPLAPVADPGKLEELAEAMEKTIHDKLHPAIGQLNVTRRRAGIAANMETEGRHLQRIQRVLRVLAQEINGGQVPPEVQRVGNREIIRNLLFQEKHPARVHWNRLSMLLRDVQEAGVIRGAALQRVRRLFDRTPHEGMTWFGPEDAVAMRDLVAEGEKKRKIWFEDHKDAIRAFRAGLDTQDQWTAARNWVIAAAERRETRPDDAEVAVRKKLRELVGRKIPGFFPTPPELARRVVAEAGVRPGMQVLEPSAGYGAIADAAREAGGDVHVFEVSPDLREILKLKGYQLLGTDFTTAQPDEVFDVVVMNPPFEHSQDADHVRRAYDWLKPGGTLVAIVGEGLSFRNQDQGFRDWLDEHGTWEKLPDNSFGKNALTGHTTGVAARLITIRKP